MSNLLKTKKPTLPSVKRPKQRQGKTLALLQRVGKSLMYPIAVLPIAALLNRIGALILNPSGTSEAALGSAQYIIGFIIQKPGAIVFDNLPIIFAIGIGFGLASDNRGEAALVAAIVWFGMNAMLGEGGLASIMYDNVQTFSYTHEIIQNGNVIDETKEYSQLLWFLKNNTPVYQLDAGVVGGIAVGSTTAFLYNRYKGVVLPQALSFFGGRRFVPMLGVLSVIPLALSFAIIWPWCQLGLIKFGEFLSSSSTTKGVGAGVYAVFNRLLQPFGLHHIPNTFMWFQLPIVGTDLNGNSVTVNGDITAFQQGVIGSGMFQTGYFPLFLGGLPAAALAMAMTSDKSRRKEMLLFYGGTGAVAFLTGIDEPLIFSFIFVSPLLYVINALFTGIMAGIVVSTQMSIGFGFSAGFIDYVVSFVTSWNMASQTGVMANPLWIWMWSAIMFAIYFPTWYFIIKKFNIPIPGRQAQKQDVIHLKKMNKNTRKTLYHDMAIGILNIVGKNNIEKIENCATRLRLTVKDNSLIDDKSLTPFGAKGVVRLGKKGYQIIIGTDVEHVADALKDL